MRQHGRDAAFEEYVAARQAILLRYAYLLCRDWQRAEDATATALAKLYVHWPKIRRAGSEDAYARTILRHVLIDDTRRSWWRETPIELVPDRPEEPRHSPEDRAALLEALMTLPLKQRQCVALRYWLDQSIEDTARELGITTGAVKSHTHRGLERLRSSLVIQGEPHAG